MNFEPRGDGPDSTRRGRREFAKRLLLAGAAAVVCGALPAQPSCQRARDATNRLGEDEMRLRPIRLTVKETLRERIAADDPANFREGNWDKVRLGLYYDEDDELVNIVVYETAAHVASSKERVGRYLPDEVWRNLIARVGPNNTAEEAVEPMVDAVMRAVPLPAGDEGPVINRPRRRPTLRSARATNGG